jgi:hypothetical protein
MVSSGAMNRVATGELSKAHPTKDGSQSITPRFLGLRAVFRGRVFMGSTTSRGEQKPTPDH